MIQSKLVRKFVYDGSSGPIYLFLADGSSVELSAGSDVTVDGALADSLATRSDFKEITATKAPKSDPPAVTQGASADSN